MDIGTQIAPRAGARLRDGRARRRERARHRRRHRGDGRDRARGHRGRRARLLHLAHAGAPRRSTASPCPAPSPPRTSSSASATRHGRDRPAAPCSSCAGPASTARTPRPRSRRSSGCAGSRPSRAARCRSSMLQADVRARTSGASCSTRARGRRGRGRRLRAQVAEPALRHAARPATRHPFIKRPTFQRCGPRPARSTRSSAELRKPEVARRHPRRRADSVRPAVPYERHGPASSPTCRRWLSAGPRSPTTSRRLAFARRPGRGRGRHPARGLLRPHARGRRPKRLFLVPFFNYAEGNHDAILEMLNHPARVLGLWPTAAPTSPRSATPRCRPTSSPLGEGPHPRAAADPRAGREDADPGHRRALRPRRSRHARGGQEGRRQRHRSRAPRPRHAEVGRRSARRAAA